MASWDDEEFDPEAGFQTPAGVSDRWEGEDEEDGVKASWEDEDEEEKKEDDENKIKAIQRKKKKKLEDIIKEKEEKRRKELEERKKEEEERLRELSPEGVLEEKLKQQKLQEEADLAIAKEAFGVADGGRVTIDSMNPKTEDEFKEFGKLLKEKIIQFQQSPHYVDLLDDLFQGCSLDLEAESLKKLGSSLTAIAQEKTKAQKATKAKKKTKKAVLAGSGKGGRSADFDAYDMGGGDLDDFM